MEYQAELIDRLWETILPHIDLDEIHEIARSFIKISERYGVTDWSGTSIEEFISSNDVDLDDDDDDEEIDDDDAFRLTSKGKATVKLIVQVSTLTNASILDVIQCGIEQGCEDHDDFDAFLLEVFMDDNHPLYRFVEENEPTVYTKPNEDDELPSLFHRVIVMCYCGLQGAFEDGEVLEGHDFHEFLAERP